MKTKVPLVAGPAVYAYDRACAYCKKAEGIKNNIYAKNVSSNIHEVFL